MREPRVVVTVTGRTVEEIRRRRDAAADADMVELRLDSMERPDVEGALSDRRKPLIVTCRAHWEGGGFTGSEDDRRKILESALRLGAEYVDVEAAASFVADLVRSRGGRGVIVSQHIFSAPPADLASRYASMRAIGAEVVKLAITVERLEQTLPLFDLARDAAREGRQGHVLIAMGNAGIPSRILAARLGSLWTYAGDGVAPGQLTPQRLLHDFRFRRISIDAALYGVVGNPIVHSLSPAMHNAGFAALGLKAAYLPLEAASPQDFVNFAKQIGLRGASVTTPLKVSLMPYLDEIEPLARRVGAINTIVVREGRWSGSNTDVDGFLSPLAQRIGLRGARVSVLGAGGAARAVAVAVESQGAKVTICARRRHEAKAIADLVGGTVGDFPPRASSWDVLVNATTVGSVANPINPVAGATLDGELVFDLIYKPADTALIRAARDAGCLTIGGIEMLIAQAERQFELWIGQRPPAGLFQAAAKIDGGDRVGVGNGSGVGS